MFSIELKYALQIVAELERTRLEGERVATPDLRRACGHEVMIFNKVMIHLTRSGWVDNDNTLSIDAQNRSLFDLAEAIGDPAASEVDYMYGWSPGNLRRAGTAVDISRSLCEEYRNRLSDMPLAALIPGLIGAGGKRKAVKRNDTPAEVYRMPKGVSQS